MVFVKIGVVKFLFGRPIIMFWASLVVALTCVGIACMNAGTVELVEVSRVVRFVNMRMIDI
jgi:hypothetical protein